MRDSLNLAARWHDPFCVRLALLSCHRDEQLCSRRHKEQADGAIQQEQAAEEQQVKDELEDPRDANTWGAKALIKEGQSILSGGLQDTASSIATFGERTVDALSGEMQREKEEKGFYKPEWTPFDSYITLSKPKHGGVNSYVG